MSKNLDTNNPKAVTQMMLKTLLSTTVRIFAPVTVLFLVGLAVDLNAATKPWGMTVGTGLGMIIASILIYSQLKSFRTAPKQSSPAGGAE